MAVTARKRSYGDFEWISIADESETKDAVKKRENQRERDSDVDYQKQLDDRQRLSAQKRMAEAQAEIDEYSTPPVGWENKTAGKSWYTIMRTRWRNFGIQCKKKGIDSLGWDIYKGLWNAAGLVTPPWGGNDTEAYKLQDRYYSKRFRCMLVRWDESGGYHKGNCGVILVEGHYKCHKNPHLKPSRYEVLSAWESDGRITDRNGKTIAVLS